MSGDPRDDAGEVEVPLADIVYVSGEPGSWQAGCTALTVVPEEATVGGHFPGHARAMRIQGPCPRCGHTLSKEISPLAQGILFAPPAHAEDSRVYFVTCNCVGAHPGAPDGVHGCGARGGVEVAPQNGGGAVSYATPSIDERDADEWVERARLEQLPRVRALASQWASTWGVIAGLIAFGTIFDADQTGGKIYGLSQTSAVAYVVLAGLALAAAVLAVIFAARAAGLREVDDILADVKSRLGLQVAMVAYCRSRLTLSRSLALCSVVLIVGALAVRFFG